MKYILMMNTMKSGGESEGIMAWPKTGRRGAHRAYDEAQSGSRSFRRTGLRRGLELPRSGQACEGCKRRHSGHRRHLPRIEGVPGRLLDRRRRDSPARLHHRCPRLCGAWTRRRPAQYVDRSASDHERSTKIVATPFRENELEP